MASFVDVVKSSCKLASAELDSADAVEVQAQRALLCDQTYDLFKQGAQELYEKDARAVTTLAQRAMPAVKTASAGTTELLTKLAAVDTIDDMLGERLTAEFDEKVAQLRLLNREYGVTLLNSILNG